MDLRGTFENRSGRVIAAFRVMIVLLFLASLQIEVVTPGESTRGGTLILDAYLVAALLLAVIAWRSWWFDHRLAGPALAIDVAVFLAAVYVTEDGDADFTSPFLAMFAGIVLSCMLRWGWRTAAKAGAATSLLFILTGSALAFSGFGLDIHNFTRRAFYMAALLLVLVWFGMERRSPQVPPLDGTDEGGVLPGLDQSVLEYAMRVCGARSGILAWSDRDEPWVVIHEIAADGTVRHAREGPAEQLAWEALGGQPRLFDLAARRALLLREDGGITAQAPAEPIALAARAGIVEGLALPVSCRTLDGQIVLGGIAGPGADFLTLGSALARAIEAHADRVAAVWLEREAAVMRARGAFARDLHDSVAQSLAGACFRLEALRRTVPSDAPPALAAEIAAVRDALRGEQAQVRGMIAALRDPDAHVPARPLVADLERVLAEAAAHWNLTARFSADGDIDSLATLSHELRQLLREAVANAARHGQASEIRAALCCAPTSLQLLIADNGSGFVGSDAPTPWSITERVAMLGGTVEVHSGRTGTRLAISLPLATPLTRTRGDTA